MKKCIWLTLNRYYKISNSVWSAIPNCSILKQHKRVWMKDYLGRENQSSLLAMIYRIEFVKVRRKRENKVTRSVTRYCGANPEYYFFRLSLFQIRYINDADFRQFEFKIRNEGRVFRFEELYIIFWILMTWFLIKFTIHIGFRFRMDQDSLK